MGIVLGPVLGELGQKLGMGDGVVIAEIIDSEKLKIAVTAEKSNA